MKGGISLRLLGPNPSFEHVFICKALRQNFRMLQLLFNIHVIVALTPATQVAAAVFGLH